MAFLDLLYVASMPVLKMLLIGGVGALLSTQYFHVLTGESLRSFNKIVYVVFTPALQFVCLAEYVTFKDLISWWSMPVNILLTFIIGTLLAWIILKITKAPKEIHGIVISTLSAGNLGYLPLILVPNLCYEKGSTFGDSSSCKVKATAYVSFSMAIGEIFIWTYAYSIIRSSQKYNMSEQNEELLDGVQNSEIYDSQDDSLPTSYQSSNDKAQILGKENAIYIWHDKVRVGFVDFCHLILHVLKSPPFIAVLLGFFVGAISPIKDLFFGDSAPSHAVESSISLLGDGTIPSSALVIGGNLLGGLKSAKIKTKVILLVILAKFILMPLAGWVIVKEAFYIGLLPDDLLYQFVLLIQYAIPPATALGTITQLFNVGEQECSVLFFWTYVFVAVALTLWSTIFMLMLA